MLDVSYRRLYSLLPERGVTADYISIAGVGGRRFRQPYNGSLSIYLGKGRRTGRPPKCRYRDAAFKESSTSIDESGTVGVATSAGLYS